MTVLDMKPGPRITHVLPGRGSAILYDDVNGVLHVHYRDTELVAIDAKTLEVLHRTDDVPRNDLRMALSEQCQELYLPAPARSEVWAYRTPALRLQRKIPAEFGVRPLAVDDERGLLFAGSLVTGFIRVLDLDTGNTLQRHYVGKYCRRVALDPVRRLAFVTVRDKGLFLLPY